MSIQGRGEISEEEILGESGNSLMLHEAFLKNHGFRVGDVSWWLSVCLACTRPWV
jgi:hypothetical protein